VKHALLGLLALLVSFGAPAIVAAQEPVRNLQDLIGARGGDGEYQMKQRGYSYVRTDKSGGSSYTYWREYRSNRCVTVRTADGRYQSIVYAPDYDCQGGQSHGGGDGWGSSGQGSGHSGTHGVTLHRDLNFTGVSETYAKDVPDMRTTRFGDDHATSVSISRGCTARLYRDLNFQGAYTEVTNDIGDLRGSRVGDDQVTSLQVRCGGGGWGGGDSWGGGDEWGDSGSSRPYGVTLHRDLDYTGTSETFTHDVPDLRGSRVGNDEATSVSISRECQARLYQHPDYEGDYTEVNGDIGDLRGSRVGNDSVTSLRVRCNR
jgi:hypothetical protein